MLSYLFVLIWLAHVQEHSSTWTPIRNSIFTSSMCALASTDAHTQLLPVGTHATNWRFDSDKRRAQWECAIRPQPKEPYEFTVTQAGDRELWKWYEQQPAHNHSRAGRTSQTTALNKRYHSPNGHLDLLSEVRRLTRRAFTFQFGASTRTKESTMWWIKNPVTGFSKMNHQTNKEESQAAYWLF